MLTCGWAARNELKASGWQVTRQAFTDDTPRGKIHFLNLVAQFSEHGKRTSPSFLLCSHYDTKMFDTIRFVGANDGGSSTGLLLELARVLGRHPSLASKIELVFFDGEEAFDQFSETDGVYGSRYFARQMAARLGWDSTEMKRRMRVIPNGVALEDFDSEAEQPHAFDAQPEFGRQCAAEMLLFLNRYVRDRVAAPR